MDLRAETVAGLARAVAERRLAARELVAHCLARIDALDGAVNAFVAVDGDAALDQARAVDDAVARGEDVGPLAGVPIGVKDLQDAAGLPTSYGSLLYQGHGPVAADSVLVARLRAAGAVVVGKTNTPELGWKAETDNRAWGATRNPWDLARTPGGSSGGSAAAVAAGMVPLATGSDGGGSIRVPSAACGLSGLKPSLGRVPAGGARPPGWHNLSTPGVLGRRMADVVQGLAAVVGPDPSDLRSLPAPEASWLGALDDPRPPPRVAWSPTLGYAEVGTEVRAVCERAVAVAEGLGAQVEVVDTVFDADPIGPWATLANAYMLRALSRWRGTEAWGRLDPGLAAQAEQAAATTALELVAAEDECHRFNLALVELFGRVDLLLTPTTAAVAPLIDRAGTVDGASREHWVRFTHPFNLTRSPAATVWVGLAAGGLPVGLQLVGPQHADRAVIRAAAALEAALALDALPPVR